LEVLCALVTYIIFIASNTFSFIAILQKRDVIYTAVNMVKFTKAKNLKLHIPASVNDR